MQIANRDRRPVRIVSVSVWGGDHLTLTESGVITMAHGAHTGGFVGQVGQTTLAAAGMASHQSEWATTTPMVGATIPPCCGHNYFVGLGFTPDLSFPTGRAAGIVVTYRTSTGHLSMTRIAAEVGFCRASAGSALCKSESKLEDRQFNANLIDAPNATELDHSGGWHEVAH